MLKKVQIGGAKTIRESLDLIKIRHPTHVPQGGVWRGGRVGGEKHT